MKKLILLSMFAFVSCSSDSETITPITTVATKVTEMRVLIIDYNKAVTISDTGFKRHSTIFYSNDSKDCGLKLNGDETSLYFSIM